MKLIIAIVQDKDSSKLSNPAIWSIGAVVYLASLSRRRSWVQIPYGPLMAELVKGLTHWFVDPACVGSIPTFRPSIGI